MGCSYILVVIDDFDLLCVCVSPKKTNSPLVIDSNAILAFPVVFKPLKAISRQGGQICQVHACGQRQKFSASRALNIQGQLFRTPSLKDSLSLGIAKAYYHVAIVSCSVNNARQSCRAGTPLAAFNRYDEFVAARPVASRRLQPTRLTVAAFSNSA